VYIYIHVIKNFKMVLLYDIAQYKLLSVSVIIIVTTIIIIIFVGMKRGKKSSYVLPTPLDLSQADWSPDSPLLTHVDKSAMADSVDDSGWTLLHHAYFCVLLLLSLSLFFVFM
jgi:hypothetical protein